MKCIAAVVVGLSLAFIGTSATFAATINVPGDQPTIAAAISASVNGDVINIATGNYYEHALDTGGKAITIQGTLNGDGSLATTIDAQQAGRVFEIQSGEGSGTVIKDLMITGGNSDSFNCASNDSDPELVGGGILCYQSSSPTISNCEIYGNSAEFGAGIACCDFSSPAITDCNISDNNAPGGGGAGLAFAQHSSPVLTNCTITGNTSEGGAGIYCSYWCNPHFISCAISGNHATDSGGGLASAFSSPTFTNCTIQNNSAAIHGGGAFCAGTGNPVLTNCIISGNTPDGIYRLGDSLRGEDDEISAITLQDSIVCGNGNATHQIQVTGMVIHIGESLVHPSCSLSNDPGDLDGDGDVDADDLALMHEATGLCFHDTNHNGVTDIDDLLDVIEGWGQSCTP